MTFNEANVNRDTSGKFDNKVGAPANVQLTEADEWSEHLLTEKLSHGGNRYDGLQAIAGRLSRHALEPTTVPGDPANGERSGFALTEVYQDYVENPEVPWTFQLDEDGLPSMMSYKGTRLRYNSDEYRAADAAALAEYGLEETEAERNTRHLRDEFERALRDGIVQEMPSLTEDEGARTVTASAVIGQSRDGRDITLNFFHTHSPSRDAVLHFIHFDGKTLDADEERRLLENSGYSDLSDALAATQECGNFHRRATGEEWDEHGRYIAEQKAAGKTPKEFKEWYDEKGVEDGTFNYQPYKADNLARIYEAFHEPKWRKLDQY